MDNAGEYAGMFRSANGKELVFKADGKRLLLDGAEQIVLQRSTGDSFVSTVPGSFSDYSLIFARQQPAGGTTPSPVVEVSYGPDWYANAAYHGDREFTAPAAYSAPDRDVTEVTAVTMCASLCEKGSYGSEILH